VIGSEDTYLRVWPLDFSEFFTEAQHEGTVCSVDISSDGLKVACGTLYGSIGILDKAN
jgi:WD40 repeat protein